MASLPCALGSGVGNCGIKVVIYRPSLVPASVLAVLSRPPSKLACCIMQKLFCVVAVCLLCHTDAQQWPVEYDVNESLPVLDISLGPPVHQMPESAVMGNVDGGVDTLQGALIAPQ